MNELISQRFENLNVTIYGTYEDPLFKASDIGNLLGISRIRDTLVNLDDNFKIKMNFSNGTSSYKSDTWFLTEQGLYKLLFISRKPIAKPFQLWAFNLIKDARKNHEIKLKSVLEIENKQQVLLREYSKKCSLVYLMRVATLDDNCYILKIGESRVGVSGRYKEHKRKYPECVLMDCFIVNNSNELEKFIHGRFSPYKYKDLVDHETENELFMIGKDLTYQMVVNTIKENLHTYDNINTESESSLKLQIEKLQLENENLKLQAQIPANIDYDMIRNLIKEELRNNAPQNVTNNFNEVLQTVGPRVQQINPENMKLIQVYENVSEVLTKWRIPRSSLTKACKENTIYKDFRWNFVERDLDANDISGVQPTKKLSKEYNLGYIAKTNLTKTEVIAVYLDRKTASMCNNYNSVAFLDNYVKNDKECDGHYYILFEKLSDEVKQAFLDKHNITTEICLYKSGVGKFTESGELLAEFRSKYHLQQELKIGEKSLNKALITGKSYNGYLFKILEEKVCLN